MSTTKTNRERLLDATAELFQRQGYAATGLTEITTRAGAPRGSLYFHFPGGKEQLGAEAIALSGTRFASLIDMIVTDAPTAQVAIQAFIDAMIAGLLASDYELGCPIATTALEASAHSVVIRRAASEAFERWMQILRERIEADGSDPRSASRDAVFALSAIEGALLLSRTANSTRPLQIAAECLAQLLANSREDHDGG